MRIAIFLLAISMYTANVFACTDDPRVADLPEFSGEPLTMTPATYLKLNPEIRKNLGDSIVICPGIPVKSGKPAWKIQTDFADIWEPMQISVVNGDWENVKFLKDAARPLPLPAEGLYSLIRIPVLEEKTMAKLGEILNINQQNKFTELDVFRVLGGKKEGDVDMILYSNTRKDVENGKTSNRDKNIIFKYYDSTWLGLAQQGLAEMGIELKGFGEKNDFVGYDHYPLYEKDLNE